MCNDNISNYNSKINDLGPLTINTNAAALFKLYKAEYIIKKEHTQKANCTNEQNDKND